MVTIKNQHITLQKKVTEKGLFLPKVKDFLQMLKFELLPFRRDRISKIFRLTQSPNYNGIYRVAPGYADESPEAELINSTKVVHFYSSPFVSLRPKKIPQYIFS